MNFYLVVVTLTILGALGIIYREITMTKADLDAAIAQLAPAFAAFGTDLQALATAINNLPQPGSDDFTPEVQAVTDALTNVNNSKATVDGLLTKLQPPPPPPPQP